jgi:hypothetical protein
MNTPKLKEGGMMLAPYYLHTMEGDATDAIQKILNEYRVCMLGPGTYTVSGIQMPEGSTLSGMGAATKLKLREDVDDGYAVRIRSYCTVRDLAFDGGAEKPESLGKRHGVAFLGNATGSDWQGQDQHAIICGCFFSGFSGGGIYGKDTGYSCRSAMAVSDCHIIGCGAGIYLEHFSEYHMFTNVLCNGCLYGCINNGGNNVFVNCGFNENGTGFLIDNSMGQSINNSHGSVIGCTFNHSGNNKGIGIQLMKANVGYIFSGCQMFYSKIVLENCVNIVFEGFNFGRNMEISIKGGKMTLFSNSVFYSAPKILNVTDNETVRFSQCYTRDGEEVTV